MNLEQSLYGKLPDGRSVTQFTLTNAKGMQVRLIDFGALTIGVDTPDRTGRVADITLGYDSLEGWMSNPPYFGATIGRCGSRIAKGRFTLDGKTYSLSINNNGRHHLHGGIKGFNKVLWAGTPFKTDKEVGVRMTYLSKDGEEGYPGNVTATAAFSLTEQNEFRIEYSATTDAPTVVNIIHHSYWNLSGGAVPNILGHILTIPAKSYCEADADLILTGKILPVAGTPLDFNKPTAVGNRIADVGGNPSGYDLHYILDEHGKNVVPAARLHDPTTGRIMEISTNQPGIQLYTGNFLDGTIRGKKGKAYPKNAGLSLETQGFPDAPNHSHFPSTFLRPGETYRHMMIHKYSTV